MKYSLAEIERWNKFVVKTSVNEDGCWLYEKNLDRDGYAAWDVDGKKVRIHRWAYGEFIAPLKPWPWTIDHVYEWGCRAKNCGNPGHLEQITNEENLKRGPYKQPRLNRVCRQGHLIAGDNIRMDGKYTRCKTCKTEQIRKANRKRVTI